MKHVLKIRGTSQGDIELGTDNQQLIESVRFDPIAHVLQINGIISSNTAKATNTLCKWVLDIEHSNKKAYVDVELVTSAQDNTMIRTYKLTQATVTSYNEGLQSDEIGDFSLTLVQKADEVKGIESETAL